MSRLRKHQIVQTTLNPLHHRVGLARPASIQRDIAGLEVLAEIVPAGLQHGEQRIEADLLLHHGVAAVVDDDVEAAARFGDEFVQKGFVGLVAGKDGRAGGGGGPFGGAGGVVFDVVEVYVGEEFEPGGVGCAGAVFHVASEADFEHLQRLVADGLEVFLVHVVVAVRRDFVRPMLAGDFKKGRSVLSSPY